MTFRSLICGSLSLCLCWSVCEAAQGAVRHVKAATNKQWRVFHLSISGTKAVSSFRVRSSGLLLAPSPFKHPVFSSSALRRDTALIMRFYRAKGYLKSRVYVDTVARDSARFRVTIRMSVHEGTRCFVSGVTVGDSAHGDDEGLRRIVKMRPGLPLLASEIISDMQAITTMLGDRGYLDAIVDYRLSFPVDSLSAAITYLYRKGPRIHVSSVTLAGVKAVRPTAVMRELRFKKKAVLTRIDLRSSVNNLYTSDLFSFASITYDSPASKDTADDSSRTIRVTVREKDFFNAEFGLGYQTYEKARSKAALSYDDFFGVGVVAFGSGSLSFIRQGVEGGVRVPWLLGLPWDFDSRLSYTRRDEKQINLEGMFTEVNSGLVWLWSPVFQTSIRHRWENRVLIKTPVVDSTGDKITHSLSGEIKYDSRDNIFDPSRGGLAILGTEVSGLSGAQSNQFIKTTCDLRIFRSIGEHLVLSSALRAGIARPYGASPVIPVEERFFLGGSNVMRGFAEKTLGPVDSAGKPIGGTFSIAWNVLELRFPIYQWFSGTLFFDAGNLWDLHGGSANDVATALSGFILRYNAGVGLRIHLPVIIIATDVGFKLDRQGSEDLAAFQLNLGHAF